MLGLHLVMVVAGLVLVGWGLPAAHRLKAPFDTLAAMGVLVGVVLSLLGALLVMVPHFFAP